MSKCVAGAMVEFTFSRIHPGGGSSAGQVLYFLERERDLQTHLYLIWLEGLELWQGLQTAFILVGGVSLLHFLIIKWLLWIRVGGKAVGKKGISLELEF